MDYEERLLNELLDIVRKRAILKRLLNSDEVKNYTEKELELLKSQCDIMTMYEETLYVRVTNLIN